ncbi:MAG: prepilin-type N-terminal cleavage/methylation domain-containing protein [Oscillospiraceae bacterium]|nr:prepilin-type N-terminal cleavage/methylation domain-containing protein [Oscillospiraceae bacterium]
MDLKKKLRDFFTLTRKTDNGFTLVELIVIIAILAILAGVAVPAYGGYIEKANEAADQQQLAALNTAFASACAVNGESHIGQSPKATINATTGKVTVTVANNKDIEDAVKTFYDGGVFKYFTALSYDGAKGVFTPKLISAIMAALKEAYAKGSFNTEAVTMELLGTFDMIGSQYFSEAAKAGFDLKSYITNGGRLSDEIADALGINGMMEGFNAAINLSDEEIQTMMERHPDYATMTEDQKADLKAQIVGNAGVLYFAQDAAGRDAEAVRQDMNNFINVLSAANYTDDVTNEQLEEYYLTYIASEQDKLDYEKAKKNGTHTTILNEFANNPEAYALNADLKFSGKELVAMSQAAGGSSGNTSGITTLGAMYAIAAGYYNSDYYNPATDGAKPSSYGDFDSISGAMNNESFWQYYLGDLDENGNPVNLSNSQAQADLEAYLTFMEYMSTNPDVKLEEGGAFTGQYEYMNGVLGLK